ncbi:MAG: SPFH/Band 7/PHB domain protein [Actinobacteria bacterium]|nr:SPFH/Band 7/PHB domain protein [Actinomycetota bacterium]
MGIFGIILFIAGLVLLIIGLVNIFPVLTIIGVVLLCVGFLFFIFAGFRTVRPTQKGIIERFGKYMRTKDAGLTWILPHIEKMYRVNITEQMVDIPPQMVITQDKLNASVDAVVYYRIKDVKASIYNVDDHRAQLTSLARTTLRAVIGNMTLTDANENRASINEKVETVLDKETASYGVEVLRCEIQKIEPPSDVQAAMNNVVKAEQEKIAARDYATATETKADGEKRAEIKRAEGVKQGLILSSEGKAEGIKIVANAEADRIKIVNEAADRYFIGNAQALKKLETVETALKENVKFIIDSDRVATIITDAAGVTPVPVEKKAQ